MTYTRMTTTMLGALGSLGDERARSELRLRENREAEHNRVMLIEAERRVKRYVGWDREKWAAAHDDLERLVEERHRMLEGVM